MRKLRDVVDTMDLLHTSAARRGVLYRRAEDHAITGRTVKMDGRDLVYFGSCSYLGLELHPEVKQGAIDAVLRYGTQFSCSRAVAANPLYAELEELLSEILGMDALVAPTTSLAHASALPLLVDERDAVVLDQQVHHSVSVATHHLLVQGTPVEVVRHNRLDMLEERIRDLRQRHHRVWYMADGVYSMFGDLVPIDRLRALLDQYPCLHLYLDDAHGMSWTGRHGRGHVLEQLPFHERLVTATSLAKAFGVGGGVLALPDRELVRRIRTVGTSFTFSGPLQPPLLGAAVASARLHLTGELDRLQGLIMQRISLWDELCRQHQIPVIAPGTSPIRFVPIGQPDVAEAVAARLVEDGIYPMLCVFPAVPMKRAGLRMALNLHQTEDDLRHAVERIAYHTRHELERAGISPEHALAIFATADAAPVPLERAGHLPSRSVESERTIEVTTLPALRLERHDSFDTVDSAEWDRLLGGLGSYNAAGIRFLERAFHNNPEPYNNWRFMYFIVREPDGRPVLATFVTETMLKSDLLSPAEVSREIEQRRQTEPTYLTAKALTLGSMYSEGEHLFLDRTADWQGALDLFLRALDEERARCGATMLALRDLPGVDAELDKLLLGKGFARVGMPESMVLEIDWADESSYLARLSHYARRHQRRKVLPFNDFYDVEVLTAGGRQASAEELDHYYALYEAVAARNLDFNSFPLPRRLLADTLEDPNWEILLLRLKPEHGGEPGALPVGFVTCFRGQDQYVPIFCGLDYRFVESHGTYRQMLRHAIERARTLGYRTVYFGFGATHEKSRYGCRPRAQNLYSQTTDAFQMEVLAQRMRAAGKS